MSPLPFVVCVGGPPGSGKSTAGRLVAARLGLEFRSVGALFREEAAARGLDLAAFGRYAEAHPDVDRALDARAQALARPGVLLEGRIQGALCRRAGTAARSIVVTADRPERLRRLQQRDGGTPADAEAALAARERSERTRYRSFYGIDLDREPSDLIVDATRAPPEEVADTIVRYLEREAGGGR